MMDKSPLSMSCTSVNQCRRFSQNAWKKDLCSNCFKSKDEHKRTEPVSRPTPSISAIQFLKPKQSILKPVGGHTTTNNQLSGSTVNCSTEPSTKARPKVSFSCEEFKVIGFGGDYEFGSSDDSCEEDQDADVETNKHDGISHDDADKDLQRLTKLNTDLNSIVGGVSEEDGRSDADDSERGRNGDKKRIHIPLMLGHTNKDNQGQKQTLHVSIKPFGSDAPVDALSKSVNQNSNTGKLSGDKTVLIESDNKSKNLLKTNIDVKECSNNVSDVREMNCKEESFQPNNTLHKTEGEIDLNVIDVKSFELQVDSTDTDSGASSNSENCDPKFNSSMANDNRRTQITRGNVITKSHQQVKTKRFHSISTSAASDVETQSTDLVCRVENNAIHTVDNGKIKLVYLILDKDGVQHTAVNKQLENLSLKSSDMNNTAVDKICAKSSNKLTADGNMCPKIFRIEQKNYKNVVACDDNVKCISFKDNIHSIGDGVYNNDDTNQRTKLGLVDDADVNAGSDVPLLSRELAGEPDGRADCNDLKECFNSTTSMRLPPPPPPPPLPPSISSSSDQIHPPRSSFLHSLQSAKVQHLKHQENLHSYMKASSLSSESDLGLDRNRQQTLQNEDAADEEGGLGQQQVALKRQAPKPPASQAVPEDKRQSPSCIRKTTATPAAEADGIAYFTHKPSAPCNGVYPLTTKPRSGSTPGASPTKNGNTNANDFTRSISQDSSSSNQSSMIAVSTSATKRGSKVRSTLRKLLRFGSRNEDDVFDDSGSIATLGGVCGSTNHVNGHSGGGGLSSPRIRPEIIHPLDLNKSAVQVLRNVTDQEQIYANTNCTNKFQVKNESEIGPPLKPTLQNGISQNTQHYAVLNPGRPNKPPPPPRSQSLDQNASPLRSSAPARPPPPISTHLKNVSSRYSTLHSASPASANITSEENHLYSNLSDDTTIATPMKPLRNGTAQEDENVYEAVVISGQPPNANRNDASLFSAIAKQCQIKSAALETNEVSATNPNVQHQIEGESNLHQAKVATAISSCCNTVEDNYKTLVTSNYETLMKCNLLASDKVFSGTCNSLMNGNVKLSWTDFSLDESLEPVEASGGVFYTAYCKQSLQPQEAVTLCVTTALSKNAPIFSKVSNHVLAKFNDFIPKQFVNRNKTGVTDSLSSVVQVAVTVMKRVTIEPFHHRDWTLPEIPTSDSTCKNMTRSYRVKEAGLVLYQLMECLSILQDCGINHINISDIMLCKHVTETYSDADSRKTDAGFNDSHISVCILPGQCLNMSSNRDNSAEPSSTTSLHECITDVLASMPIPKRVSILVRRCLSDSDKIQSLFNSKAVLGLWLWSPLDDILASPTSERQNIIQLWLDLERAKTLQILLMSSCGLPADTYNLCCASFIMQMDMKDITEALALFSDGDHCISNIITCVS